MINMFPVRRGAEISKDTYVYAVSDLALPKAASKAVPTFSSTKI